MYSLSQHPSPYAIILVCRQHVIFLQQQKFANVWPIIIGILHHAYASYTHHVLFMQFPVHTRIEARLDDHSEWHKRLWHWEGKKLRRRKRTNESRIILWNVQRKLVCHSNKPRKSRQTLSFCFLFQNIWELSTFSIDVSPEYALVFISKNAST